MTPTETLLESHHNLLRATAWKISKNWYIPYDEVLGECYLIFCEAVEKFDSSRGIKFSTFLYSQLRQLTEGCLLSGKYRPGPHGICRKEEAYRKTMDTKAFEFMVSTATLLFFSVNEFYERAGQLLSDDGYILLYYVLDIGIICNQRSVQKEFKKLFNWMNSRTKQAWAEVKQFWLQESSSYITI